MSKCHKLSIPVCEVVFLPVVCVIVFITIMQPDTLIEPRRKVIHLWIRPLHHLQYLVQFQLPPLCYTQTDIVHSRNDNTLIGRGVESSGEMIIHIMMHVYTGSYIMIKIEFVVLLS